MEQRNIDRFFRERLESREITPSPDSWTKMEQQLSSGQRKRTPILSWLLAAAVLSGIMIGGWWMSHDPLTLPQGKEIVVEEVPQEIVAPKQQEQAPTHLTDTSMPPESSRASVYAVREVTSVGVIPSEAGFGVPPLSSPVSPEPVIAEVTDDQIEYLLDQAMLETSDSLTRGTYIAADELLEVVEFELEESFREKVFEVVREGFSKAKTAIANRNQ